MNVKLIDHIAATIRRVDGNHTMGAASLAEAIVENLADEGIWDDGMVEPAVYSLTTHGWENTRDGGSLNRRDMADVARVVLHGTFADV